jgi:N6-adenosine-specific RNA methylase IME4
MKTARPIASIEFHALANLFPLIEGAEFDALVDDIRAHGVREPIWTLDGKILDGRNRYLAACSARVVCPVRAYEGNDPVAFVVSLNLARRHLDEGQRAMIAAKLATMRQGARTDLSPIGETSQATAAKLLNVSKRSVERATKVRDEGAPELQDAVEQGHVAVSVAAELAGKPVEQQRDIIAALLLDADGRLTPEARKALTPIIKEIRAEQAAAKKIMRATREAALGGKLLALPNKKYGVVYADPEWRLETYSQSGLTRHAANHFSTSTTEVIAARPVADIAADDCVLFLWAIVPMLPDALAVMSAWGFAYKSHLAWKKPHAGTGFWFRNRHELLLVGTRGKIPAPALGDQWESVIEAPTGRYGEKPVDAYELIEAYFPTLPKIELNARASRDGWDSWGFEAPSAMMEAAAQ